MPATSHASGPGRYARELVRALVRLPEAPEIGLYEVGRAPRVFAGEALGLEGARVRRLVSTLPRGLREGLPFPGCGPADRALGGVELFHRILPGTPRLERARTCIAIAELPARGSGRERAWAAELRAAAGVFVFCADYRERVAERFGVPLERIHQVPVGCEHWSRRLPAPIPRADPLQVIALDSGPHDVLRAAVEHLSSPGRRVELVLARELGLSESELPARVAAASALVHLDPGAGTAVTPLEALALGTPVVLPRAPAFEEALGEQAFWAEPLEDALEAALESARDPQASRARIGYSRAFSWENSARAHLAVWNRMTN
ncbi:MAG: hypothetical protein IPJ19_03495 [Planctomycetes bacterium]|nr:hypothetical protein [Planctomycetota bacterium]